VAYSTVWERPIKTKRRANIPTIDGESVVQELGYVEVQGWRFYWITNSELQDEIDLKEAMASDGWVLVGDPNRTPIHDALDLYNARITVSRFVAT